MGTAGAWVGALLATHEENRFGPILMIVAVVLAGALLIILFVLRSETRAKRKASKAKAKEAEPGP